MNARDAAEIVSRFNLYRRGILEHLPFSPAVITEALDLAGVSLLLHPMDTINDGVVTRAQPTRKGHPQ